MLVEGKTSAGHLLLREEKEGSVE
ncbi:protein of unknown function [Candidatus Nitrospira inopinata]|uniref:Uncharacterized protein n=1 Tax=Candidatus Nitrospira inopinata TaxID=1715989 RepID=A0A0S4KVJ8_9BACT|nr:protein of unknown function [Candidatus Nitrospira inopinata]